MQLKTRPWQIVSTIALLALVLAVANLLIVFLNVALLIFAGLLFGIFLHAIMEWLTKKTGQPYAASFGIVIVGLLGLVIGMGIYLQAQIEQQVIELSGQLEQGVQQVQEYLKGYPWAQDFLQSQDATKNAMQNAQRVLPAIGAGLNWLMWGFTGIIVIFFVGLYVAFDPRPYEVGLVKLVPPRQRPQAEDLLHTLKIALTRWIVGRIFSMSVIGMATGIGLWLLGVPMPAALGVIAAILTFIPNLGPLLALVPQALLALRVGTDTLAYVVILNLALQGIESYLLTPLVERHQVTLPPALTISVQLLFGVLIGIMGVMMAAPLTVVIMVLVQKLYIQETLGDDDPGKLSQVE